MRFNKFLSIEISHDYFEDRWCKDLYLLPTTRCNSLLKNCEMRFSNTSQNRASVFAAVTDEDKLLVEPPVGELFDFFIFLDSPDFLSYTNLPKKKGQEIYFFSSENIESTIGSMSISVIKQPIKSIAGKILFGYIQIVYNGTFRGDYTLQFEAASTKWKYYLLSNKSFKNLTINGTLAGITFNKKNESGNNQTDNIRLSINKNYPDANLIVFESQNPVSYNSMGRKDIQLVDADKNNVLINHLPNPTFNENGIKIINIIN